MRAKPRSAAAAILKEEEDDAADLFEFGAIDDRAAAALGPYETGAGQHSEMARHGVLRNAKPPRDLPGGHAFGLGFDEQPKGVETGALSQGRECADDSQ